MATERAGRNIVDVRHTTPSETVVCQWIGHDRVPWAQFVIAWQDGRQMPRQEPRTVYLCRDCLTQFLMLADGLGVG